jgi:hypothetical protein
VNPLEPEMVLVRLAMLGIDVELEGDRLRLSGQSASLPEELRVAIREVRPGIIALLKAQGGSMLPEPESGGALREVLCMTCYGTVFVRLKNRRRCVCPTCEAVRPEEIEGLDHGYAGAPLDEERGGA